MRRNFQQSGLEKYSNDGFCKKLAARQPRYRDSKAVNRCVNFRILAWTVVYQFSSFLAEDTLGPLGLAWPLAPFLKYPLNRSSDNNSDKYCIFQCHITVSSNINVIRITKTTIINDKLSTKRKESAKSVNIGIGI